MEENKPMEKKPEMGNNKICAVLSYLIIGLIWYAVDDNMKKDAFVKYHVKQGLVLLIASFVIQFVGWIIPVIGWFLIVPLGHLLTLILAIIGIANAANHQTKELPIIGQFAKKLDF